MRVLSVVEKSEHANLRNPDSYRVPGSPEDSQERVFLPSQLHLYVAHLMAKFAPPESGWARPRRRRHMERSVGGGAGVRLKLLLALWPGYPVSRPKMARAVSSSSTCFPAEKSSRAEARNCLWAAVLMARS